MLHGQNPAECLANTETSPMDPTFYQRSFHRQEAATGMLQDVQALQEHG